MLDTRLLSEFFTESVYKQQGVSQVLTASVHEIYRYLEALNDQVL